MKEIIFLGGTFGCRLVEHYCDPEICSPGDACPTHELGFKQSEQADAGKVQRAEQRWGVRVSLFHEIVARGCRMDSELWAQVYDITIPNNGTLERGIRKEHNGVTSSSGDPLYVLRDKVVQEFSGYSPAAKVNFLGNYANMLSVWEAIVQEVRVQH